MKPVHLDHEGRLLAGVAATSIIAVGPDAGDEYLLDFVFAGPIENKGAVEAGRQQRLPVPRELALGARQWAVVRMTVGDDVAADPATRRPDDRLVRIRYDDG